MSFISPEEMRVPKYAVIRRTITSNDVVYGPDKAEVSRQRTDFTGGFVFLAVSDDAGNILIKKKSDNVAQIEVKDQNDPAARGQADVLFVEADTQDLDVGGKYWFDSWFQDVNGEAEPITDRGRFYVDESVVRISTW